MVLSTYFIFQPCLGKWSSLTSTFFQMGWFNHQLDVYLYIAFSSELIFYLHIRSYTICLWNSKHWRDLPSARHSILTKYIMALWPWLKVLWPPSWVDLLIFTTNHPLLGITKLMVTLLLCKNFYCNIFWIFLRFLEHCEGTQISCYQWSGARTHRRFLFWAKGAACPVREAS